MIEIIFRNGFGEFPHSFCGGLLVKEAEEVQRTLEEKILLDPVQVWTQA